MNWASARNGAALGLQALNPSDLVQLQPPTVTITLNNQVRGLIVTKKHPSLKMALALQSLCETSQPVCDSRRGMAVELAYFSVLYWRR